MHSQHAVVTCTRTLVLAATFTVVVAGQALAQSPADFVSGTVSGNSAGGDPALSTTMQVVPAGKVFVLTDVEYWAWISTGARVEGDVSVYQGSGSERWSTHVLGYENSSGAERHMLSKSFATGIAFPSGSVASFYHQPWGGSTPGIAVNWRLSWSGYLVSNSLTGVNDSAPRNELRLGNATPNPVDDETHIGFSLSRHSRITLRVVDVYGRVVRTLFNGPQPAGEHNLVWNARNDDGQSVPSGVYFIELLADRERHARKAVVLN